MARDRDRRKILWPSYFNVKLSRAQGRRIPKAYCIENPNVDAISAVLKSLKYSFEVEPGKAFPSKWWKNEGRIVVDTDMAKTQLITEIGKKLKK